MNRLPFLKFSVARTLGAMIVIGVLSPVVFPTVAMAQPGFNRQSAANEVTEFTGTLKTARGNLITVTREDGVDCMVQFPDEITSVNFVATAVPAYLRRGMPIRFATTLGPGGQPLTPIDRIEVFAPVNPSQVSHSQREKFMPGIHAADRGHAAPKNAPMTGKVTVVGTLVMLTPQGGLALQAGEYPVQTMVAPDLKLELRVNNLSLAQPGDPVRVSGFYQPPDDTKVKADSITITADRVYGEAPPPKERRVRKSRRDLEAAPETAAAEETSEQPTAQNGDNE